MVYSLVKMRQLYHKYGTYKPPKYGNKKTEYLGRTYSSKLEAECARELDRMKKEGKILFFLEQVPLKLAGKNRHYVDFLVFYPDTVEFIESKGRDLPLGKLKREQCEEIYGIKIWVIKSVADISKVRSD